jgi:hypothetical protein
MKNGGRFPRILCSYKVLFPITLAAFIVILLIGCQPRTAEPSAQEPPANGETAQAEDGAVDLVDFEWGPDSDCGICHAKEIETTDASACPQAGATPDTCMTCHVQEPELVTVHANVTTAETTKSSRLKQTVVEESLCLECHDSYEVLAVKTSEVTTLTDDNGLTVNPHAIPTTGNHDEITCTSCHVKHGKSNAARRVCVGCHHQTVWECNTCHSYEYE